MQLLKKCIISGLQTDAFLDFTITNDETLPVLTFVPVPGGTELVPRF